MTSSNESAADPKDPAVPPTVRDGSTVAVIPGTLPGVDETPPAGPPAKLRAERMPFGRWMRLVGWRHVVCVIFVLWSLFPAFYVINLAFSGGNTLTAGCPADRTGLKAISCVIPTKFDGKNFSDLLGSDQYPFMKWVGNTLLVAGVNSAAALLMGAAAAYAFSRLRFKGRRIGLLGLLLVQMFPAVLAITAIYTLMSKILDVFPAFGLGHVWGLVLVYLGGALGVNTFLMKGYFDTIPVDIDESARIDGSGHVRIFFGLILRLATPILVVVFFVSFQASFNELPVASIILPDQQNTTLAVGLNGLVSNPTIQNWGLLAAGGVMAAIPLFILFLFTQRSLVTGLTGGAVKG